MGILDKIKSVEVPDVSKAAASTAELQEKVSKFLADNNDKLKKWFSDNQLEEKLSKVAKKAGAVVIFPVLLLYNLFKSDHVPAQDKMMIIASLAYFIMPMDIIPDVILGVGYADDGLAIMTCLKKLASSITPQIMDQTREMSKGLLGEIDEKDIKHITDLENGKTE